MRLVSDAERVWARLRFVAAGMAARDVFISDLQARVIVDRIIDEEHMPSKLAEAREYFACGLRDMIRASSRV